MLAGAEHSGAELGKDLFGQIGVGQQPGGAAQGGKEAEAPGQRHALHAQEPPGAAIRAADPAFQAVEDGDAGIVRVGQRSEELGPEALPGPAAELRGRRCRACRRRAGARPRAGARGRAGCGLRARRWRRALSGGRGLGGLRGGVRGREARRGAGQRRTQLRASSRPRPPRRGGGRGRGRPIRRRRAVPRPALGSNGGYGRGGRRRRWWTWALSRDETRSVTGILAYFNHRAYTLRADRPKRYR